MWHLFNFAHSLKIIVKLQLVRYCLILEPLATAQVMSVDLGLCQLELLSSVGGGWACHAIVTFMQLSVVITTS